MAPCERCGQQLDDQGEFCAQCSGDLSQVPAGRSQTASAVAAAGSYLRPFAPPGAATPVLSDPGEEPGFWAYRDVSAWPDPTQEWMRVASATAALQAQAAVAQTSAPAAGPEADTDTPEAGTHKPEAPGGDKLASPADHDALQATDLATSDDVIIEPDLALPPAHPADVEPPQDAGVVVGHSGRLISATTAALVVIIAAGAVVLLAHHGRPNGPTAAHKPSGRPTSEVTTAPAPRAASPMVAVAPAATSAPQTPAIVAFLTRYFTVINEHRYPAYRRLFDPGLRDGLSAAAFEAGYGSSQDSGEMLKAISPTATGQVAVTVTFTSHQQAAASPTQSGCTNWSITLYLSKLGPRYVIESPPVGYQPTYAACG